MPDPIPSPAPAPAATPTPAPAAAPSPEPSPTPSPEPSPSPGETQADADAWARLESKYAATPATTEKPAEKPEGEETPPPPAEKTDEPPKPSTEPPAKPDKTIQSAPKALRIQIDRLTGELKAKSEAHDALQKRIAEMEGKTKDTTALSEQLATVQKQLQEAHASLRAAKQELTPEFKEKYDKPFDEAATVAKTEIEALAIVNEEGEPVRQATWDKDFAALYNLEYIRAKTEAKKMFGEDAPLVMDHWLRLHRLSNERARALDKEKAQWSERTKADEAAAVQRKEAFEKATAKVQESMIAAHPEWYGEDPKDPEGNAALKEGLSLVDSTPKSLQEAAILRANIRLRAAASFRLMAMNKRLSAELEAAKKTIEEMKSSGPGPTKRPSSATPAPEKDWHTELREAMAG